MYNLLESCILIPLDEDLAQKPFSCGDADLDDFLHNDAVLYAKQRLGKTYCFVTEQPPTAIVAFFTLSNSSIRVEALPSTSRNRFQRRIPNPKRMHSYPAILIGRLGVSSDFHGNTFLIGRQLMGYLKNWLSYDEGCASYRFLVVDAYNTPNVLSYYQRNDFSFLFHEESAEREEMRLPDDEPMHTRMMYYDLLSR